MSKLEFDPDLDLQEQISSYTEQELKQLETITLEVIAHWQKMIQVCGANMNEGTRMAIDLSLEQANKDLVVIRERMEKVKSDPTVRVSPQNGEVSDSH
jgi:hypothetical protein